MAQTPRNGHGKATGAYVLNIQLNRQVAVLPAVAGFGLAEKMDLEGCA